MSEDSALRRAKAARFVRQFPALLGAVARGELHLTGLLLLGPHLTQANLVEVLALSKHRSKKEIEKLVRRLDPLPDVAPRIEPLGPLPSGLPRASAPTWQVMAAAFAGPVRELRPGERPSDWTSEPDENSNAFELASPTSKEKEEEQEQHPRLVLPERYKVQFTATQEYVDLLDEARDLLSHAAPNAGLDEVHQRALECLVRELRKSKYGETAQPREAKQAHQQEQEQEQEQERERRTSRHIPAAVRRRVAERDLGRCTYVDACGQRCRETRLLEFHHHQAHAHGGPPTEANIALRCRSHNTLAAEQDFGRELVSEKQGRADPRQRRGFDPPERGKSERRAGTRERMNRSGTRPSAADPTRASAADPSRASAADPIGEPGLESG